MIERILIAALAADLIFIAAALVRELWLQRRPAKSKPLAPPDSGRYYEILAEIYEDWRGERRYYPPRYHEFFEANDDARIAYAKTVAARAERAEGRAPSFEDPGAAREAFAACYAWELHRCR